MVNRFDMGQNGVLDPSKLVFTDNIPGPEKIEVVMGRCFPLHGPGGTYDFPSIPVVRKIVYKNSDGATFTQTFGDLISSENENYKIPTSLIEQHFDAEKQGCKPKTFLKHEASDGIRDDPLISSNDINSKKNGDLNTHHEKALRIIHPSTGTHESRKDRHQEKMFLDAQVKNLQFQQRATLDKTGNDTQENYIRKHETNMPSITPDIQERLSQTQPGMVINKANSQIKESPSLEYHEKSPKSSRDKPESTTQLHKDTTFSRKPFTVNSTLNQGSVVDQHQNKVTPVNIDSDTIRRISKANSPRFRVKRVENSKPPEMSGREAWEETQKKKAQLREEFFRVPYEECNREALRGMGGRHKSEPRLNSLAKERKKRNSLSEKRVHFNMDDSQLEDIRKWREERRMQATPQCIKTVARIYSIDAPSNQRKVEYIDSFSVPKAEVPDAVTLLDCTSVRAKHSRPTDLDSLKGNFASKVSLASNVPPNHAACSSDSNFPRKKPVENSPEYSIRSQMADHKRFEVPQMNKGTSEVNSRVPLTSHRNLKDENQSPAPMANNPSLNGVSVLSPSASLYATFSKPPERKISPFEDRFESQLTADQQDAKFSLRYHPHGPPRSISSPKLIDTQLDSQISKGNSPAVKVQNIIPPKIPFDHTDNNRVTSNLEDLTKKQEHQDLQQFVAVQSQRHQKENEGHAGETQEKIDLSSVVELRNHRPTSFQSPLPLPRVRSLTSKEDLTPQDTPSTSIQMDTVPSERSRAFSSGRATSLDRATIRQRSKGLPVNSSPYLKSPGLILSHMRSPVTTTPTHNHLIGNPMDGKNNSFSPYKPNSTSDLQNNQSDVLGTDKSKFAADITPTVSKSDQPVDIIKSYTYPKRSSVTVLQKDQQHTDIGATAKSTVSNFRQNDYHKHATQNFKPLVNSSDIHNNLDIYGSQFNKSAKPSFQAAASVANSKVTHKNANKENEENTKSQKTIPNRKGNSVNILMTQGESYSKHRIHLNTHTKSMSPRMTVKKIIVPASSVSGYARPGPSASTRSPPSPTPSCASSSCSFGSSGSSSGCFSGSPSPTPTPSPIRTRASRVPTDL